MRKIFNTREIVSMCFGEVLTLEWASHLLFAHLIALDNIVPKRIFLGDHPQLLAYTNMTKT